MSIIEDRRSNVRNDRQWAGMGILRAIMNESEKDKMSSMKVGDIVYVSLDEEDGLTLTRGYSARYKYIVIIGFTPEGQTDAGGFQFLRETDVFDNAAKRRYGIIE